MGFKNPGPRRLARGLGGPITSEVECLWGSKTGDQRLGSQDSPDSPSVPDFPASSQSVKTGSRPPFFCSNRFRFACVFRRFSSTRAGDFKLLTGFSSIFRIFRIHRILRNFRGPRILWIPRIPSVFRTFPLARNQSKLGPVRCSFARIAYVSRASSAASVQCARGICNCRQVLVRFSGFPDLGHFARGGGHRSSVA